MGAEASKENYDTSFLDIPQPEGVIQAEYVWIGGTGMDLRCKTKTIYTDHTPTLDELPIWNYDGSSTGQAPGDDSEVMLKPAAIFPDPFRKGKNILVLCDTYLPSMKPIPSNTRARAMAVLGAEKSLAAEPWFGIEQEFILYKNGRILGWPKDGGYPGKQGPFYCSAVSDVAFGRAIIETHYRACLYAGIKIAGINAEVLPGQWEFQIGPCLGIEEGDHLWMARYLLDRVCEAFGCVVELHPKPAVLLGGDWNGSGCHTNYSTKAMREDGGYEIIKEAVEKLRAKHDEHIAIYGEGNDLRMSGQHETSDISEFSAGVANRGCSIRIPRDTEKFGKGYFEDRRPASNIDPYLVTAMMVSTTLDIPMPARFTL